MFSAHISLNSSPRISLRVSMIGMKKYDKVIIPPQKSDSRQESVKLVDTDQKEDGGKVVDADSGPKDISAEKAQVVEEPATASVQAQKQAVVERKQIRVLSSFGDLKAAM